MSDEFVLVDVPPTDREIADSAYALELDARAAESLAEVSQLANTVMTPPVEPIDAGPPDSHMTPPEST